MENKPTNGKSNKRSRKMWGRRRQRNVQQTYNAVNVSQKGKGGRVTMCAMCKIQWPRTITCYVRKINNTVRVVEKCGGVVCGGVCVGWGKIASTNIIVTLPRLLSLIIILRSICYHHIIIIVDLNNININLSFSRTHATSLLLFISTDTSFVEYSPYIIATPTNCHHHHWARMTITRGLHTCWHCWIFTSTPPLSPITPLTIQMTPEYHMKVTHAIITNFMRYLACHSFTIWFVCRRLVFTPRHRAARGL